MDYIKVGYSEFIQYKIDTECKIDYLENDAIYDLFLSNGNFKLNCTITKTDPANSDQLDFETNYKNSTETNSSTKSLVEVAEQTPFAKPEYRTKRDGTATWEVCTANSSTILDFPITAERFVSGGEILFKNAKEGDWISAEVFDKDNVIPEPYRAILCEAHPTVAEYIPKKWIKPTESGGYGSFEIDTHPLNAKISAGLYLRVTYHASTEIGDRKCAVNYYLTQKL